MSDEDKEQLPADILRSSDVETPKEQEKEPDDPKRPWLFQKGVSGNPHGRPKKGQWYKDQIKILKERTPELMHKIIKMALDDGDPNALKLWAARVIPKPKSRDIPFAIDLTALSEDGNSTADLLRIGAEVINARANNEVGSAQAQELFDMLESQRKAIETDSIQTQLDEIKEKLGN